MNDSTIKALVAAGLLLQAAAVALGFTAAGWRWPIAVATAAIALGVLGVQIADAPPRDAVGRGIALFSVAALAAAAWHAASASPYAAWTARVFFGVEALGQILIALFFLFFRMNRLW